MKNSRPCPGGALDLRVLLPSPQTPLPVGEGHSFLQRATVPPAVRVLLRAGVAAVLLGMAPWPAASTDRPLLDESISQALALTDQRDTVLAEAAALIDAGERNQGMDTIEAYLRRHPSDLVAGNAYRRMAVSLSLQDRPIRFFNELLAATTPRIDDGLRAGVPLGLRYNLAFAYIDKIPVVGPMGAGFLSKRSIGQFQLALLEDRDDWIANYGVGMNYLHWPDYFEKNDSSIAYFERCIQLQDKENPRPLDILPYIRLGDAHAKAGFVDDAFETWRAGQEIFGDYGDLAERFAVEPSRIKGVVTDAYIPNNSIGEIDTDISILWATELPDSLFSLRDGTHLTTFSKGVGGQKPAETKDDEDLFVWFQKNLPFLLRRESAEKMDMSYLGRNAREEAGLIAYNMIRGFMTQLYEEDVDRIKADLDATPAFERPFFREGVGMGLAGKLDIGGRSLADFDAEIAPYGDGYERLQYAGLGMWYGLTPTPNMVRINHDFADLDLRGRFYAYEGLGFAVTLFNSQSATRAIGLSRRLPFAAAATYSHGLGRALWIKFGGDRGEIEKVLEQVPEKLRSAARSGLGMGIAFTRVEDPDSIMARLSEFGGAGAGACRDVLVGASMGLAIRYETNAAHVRKSLRNAEDPMTRRALPGLLKVGLSSLRTVRSGGQDLHANWRAVMDEDMSKSDKADLRNTICGVV